MDTIREQDPLKQGLKLSDNEYELETCKIREQDPLKQGLKQNIKNRVGWMHVNSRARSTKTRIETRECGIDEVKVKQFASKIH